MAFRQFSMSKILGHSDEELLNDKYIKVADNFTIEKCKQCKFYITALDDFYEVYKAPMFDFNNLIIGTAGYVFKITENKNELIEKLEQMVLNKEALKFMDSNNYYIIEDHKNECISTF